MIYKQSISTDKPWAPAANVGYSPAALMAKLRNLVKIEIPVGYQDEAGFHYGVKRNEKDAKWSTTW